MQTFPAKPQLSALMQSCGAREASSLGSDAVVRVVKRNRTGQKVGIERIIELSLSQLEPLFKFPLFKTTEKLGISSTALKRQNLQIDISHLCRGRILI